MPNVSQRLEVLIPSAPSKVDGVDMTLVQELRKGLPFAPRPYAIIGERLGMMETEVIQRLSALLERGILKRFGIIVHHHELGYRANAMVVWDVPDHRVSDLGHCLGRYDFVTLCYRRERRPPRWPYNLYCMIHGKDPGAVLEKLHTMRRHCGLEHIPYRVLFSKRRFKQCAASYQQTGKV